MSKRTKVSKKLRERLLQQKSRMSSGVLIDNKKFTKGRFRILPAPADEVPGREYISFYCESLDKGKRGTTSPSAFGLRCPVLDAQKDIKLTGDKEDKQFAWDFVNVNREYWMTVIDRMMEGDASAPNIRILRAKSRIYQQIVDFMLDEDDGEDITDKKTGRDVRIRKKGSGTDTEWTIKFLDAEPLSEDADYTAAVLALNAKFNVQGMFYNVDWDILEEIYKGLTGEDCIPDTYDDVKEQLSAGKSAKADDDDDDEDKDGDDADADGDEDADADGDEDADADADADGDGDDDADGDGDDEITVGMTVTFTDGDGNESQGELVDTGKDKDGDTYYEVNDGDDVWTVYEVTPVEEPDDEPDEVPPTVDKKKPTKKKGSSKKTPSKPKGKPKSKASSKIRANLSKNKKKKKGGKK